EFLDCDCASWRQCAPDFFQEAATAVAALAMQNMAERCHLVPAAKISLGKLARSDGQSVRHPVPGGDLFCDLEHARPVHRADADLGRLFLQRDTPNAGTG